MDIAPFLINLLKDYFTTYSDRADGYPIFAGGSYFRTGNGETVSKEQTELPIVDSYSISVTLSLATLGFVTAYAPETQREQVRADLKVLETLAQARLSGGNGRTAAKFHGQRVHGR